MGAYCLNNRPAHKVWKQAIRKKQQLIFSPPYRAAMYDECIMAVVFGYNAPCWKKSWHTPRLQSINPL